MIMMINDKYFCLFHRNSQSEYQILAVPPCETVRSEQQADSEYIVSVLDKRL